MTQVTLGTGSGLGRLLRVQFFASAVVEPYSTVLRVHSSFEHLDLIVTMDNEAFYRICRCISAEPLARADHLSPTALNVDVTDFITILATRPRITLCFNYAPIMSAQKVYRAQLSVAQITMFVFQFVSVMVERVPFHGKYMVSRLKYQGALVQKECRRRGGHCPIEAHHSVSCWSQTGFSCGINHHPPKVVQRRPGIVLRAVCTTHTVLIQEGTLCFTPSLFKTV